MTPTIGRDWNASVASGADGSWTDFPRGRDRRAGFPRANQKSEQFCFEHERIHALQNRSHSFQRHLPLDLLLANARFQLARDWQVEEIRGSDSINGGHECDRYAPSYFIDFIQMLHHLNQAEDGANDADGGGKSSGGLKHLRNLFLIFGLVVEF